MKKEKFIDIRRLIASKNPRLLKWIPGFVIRYLKRILHQDEINDFLDTHGDLNGQEFCTEIMKYFDIKVEVEGIERIPKEGGVTLAMNHPLGGMDAIALVHALRGHREDIQFIVNDLLMNLEPLKKLFVGVDKHGKNRGDVFRKLDELFGSGKMVCIFPAGLVSRKIEGKVRDLPWKKTFVSQSRKNEIPIIPVHINGRLSNFFYRLHRFRSFLGVKANVEMLYLSNELFKQRGAHMKFTVGEVITPEQLQKEPKDLRWAEQIREDLYKLGQ
ncbi:MAG: glycerol acyltransferase [Bacteroidetes bacterium]|nr:MAG: glycerol acyltransferase [Bacteroidota bacterium]